MRGDQVESLHTPQVFVQCEACLPSPEQCGFAIEIAVVASPSTQTAEKRRANTLMKALGSGMGFGYFTESGGAR